MAMGDFPTAVLIVEPLVFSVSAVILVLAL